MTLLIAVLLIKGFKMEWWLYMVAVAIWAIHVQLHIGMRERNFDVLSNRLLNNFRVTDRVLEEQEE